jgi:nucleoside recognition membrane protein YjiH
MAKSTTFSVVSITFAIVIAETVGLQHKFFAFYLTVIIILFNGQIRGMIIAATKHEIITVK